MIFYRIKGSQQYVIDEAKYLAGENTNIFNHVLCSRFLPFLQYFIEGNFFLLNLFSNRNFITENITS